MQDLTPTGVGYREQAAPGALDCLWVRVAGEEGERTAVLATWAAGLYQDWLSHGQALILGAAIGLAAPIGDLFESQVKRDAGTKDAGTLFGAHGGALDRLDAAFFTLVTGYYVWLAMM